MDARPWFRLGPEASCELASGLHFVYPYFMMKSISVPKKKGGRGRPATGHDPSITVRIPANVLEAAVNWGKVEGISRAKAVARLVEIGLDAAPKRRKEKG
jgi:hypothetical protein